MASIESSIKLNDGMSSVLRSINDALETTISRFEKLEAALNTSFNPSKVENTNRKLGVTNQKVEQAAAAERRFQQEVTKTLGAIYKQTTNQVRLTAEIRKTPPVIQQAAAAQENFNQKIVKGTGHMSGFVSKLKTIVATYLGIQTAKGIIGTSDELTNTTARLNMINDGLQTTAQLEEKIYQAAMRSRGGFLETADAVAKLGLRAGSIFKNNEEIIAFSETLNKMFVIAGASQQEMASATLQLTQALGSGVLRGEEFNAVFEAAPNVMQAVADYIGQPIGKLKQLASEGKISAEVVKNALFSATDKVNKQFESMPMTWAQVWSTIKNYTIKASRPILSAISKLTSNQRFIRFANAVGNVISHIVGTIQNAFSLLKPVLIWIYDTIAAITNFFVEKWSFISPIVYGVAAAFAFLKLKLMAVAIWSGICAAATAIMTGAKIVATFFTWAFTKATLAQAGAQWGLNAALYACPLTWIIIAIIAVIVVIYLAVAAINHFADTSYSATGFIAGTFMLLFATIYNGIAFMWNTFAIFAEFLVNVFKHPTFAAKKLFVNLAVNVLDCLIAMTKGCDEFATNFANAILWAVNKAIEGWNAFVDILPDSISSAIGLGKGDTIKARTSFTSDLEGVKNKLNNWVKDEPDDYWTAPKMEFKDLGEAYNKGYDWGAEKATQLENLVSGKKFKDLLGTKELEDLMNQYGPGNVDKYGNVSTPGMNDIGKALSGGLGKNPALDAIKNGVGDIANDTGKISGALDKSEDDLSFMRDLAEQEAINRHYYTDLKVEMNNNNNIGSNLDSDAIIERMRRGLFEAVSACAEGTHF